MCLQPQDGGHARAIRMDVRLASLPVRRQADPMCSFRGLYMSICLFCLLKTGGGLTEDVLRLEGSLVTHFLARVDIIACIRVVSDGRFIGRR